MLHITNEHHQQSHDTKVTPSGLMNLIANVTQTIAAMEAEAQRLEEELQRMRQTTRQLLSKYRKDALWTAIHKCVFFYGCNKQNYIPRTTGNGANTTFSQNAKPTPILSSSNGRSMKNQRKTKIKSP
jgi:lipoate-protein ligase B